MIGRAYGMEAEIAGITVKFPYRVLRGMFLKQGPFSATLTKTSKNNTRGTYRVSPGGKGDGLHVMIGDDLARERPPVTGLPFQLGEERGAWASH